MLGILIVNIRSFAKVSAAYLNPFAAGPVDGVEFWSWAAIHLLADTKFISIFSVLFGAGIAMMSDRMAARGAPSAGLHYRRQFWLLLIGFLHAYLVWHGDILVSYALCGFLLYPLRNLRPRAQLVLGFAAIAVAAALVVAGGVSIPYWSEELRAAVEAQWAPPRELIDAEIAAYTGDWTGQVIFRVEVAQTLETSVFLFHYLWRVGGLMLIGMALYRLGVLSAGRSVAFYRRTAVLGIGIGLPVVAAGIGYNVSAGFSWEQSMFYGMLFNQVGSAGVFLGYVALLMLTAKAGLLAGPQRWLAATGRMALTNYIAQSLVCTLIFYGHGLGLFEQLGALSRVGIVVAVWALQLAWSPWWLRRFRYGPLEWLWRTASYMKRQPFRA